MDKFRPLYEEEINVSSTIVTLSSAKYANADKVFMTLRNSAICFDYINTPSTDQGHPLLAAQNLTLYGYHEMAGLKMVGATTSTGSTGARLNVTYFEKMV